jgi:DNA end-binding protein Ku
MAATVWKGYITFGLISIPVRLFSAARDVRVEFHQVHEKCGTRVKQHLYCPHCDREVERSEIVKGHETDDGQMVIVEAEDIEKIAPASSETMEIQEVVKLAEIDPVYFDASYYAVPEPAGTKAYSLLHETMKDTGLAAVAKLAMHRREYTVIIRPHVKGLALHTMYYENEVREVPEYERIKREKISDREIKLAQQVLHSLEAEWDPSKFADEYQQRLEKMVEAKAKGKTVRATAKKAPAPVVDLMEALQRSLKARGGGATKKRPKVAKQARKAS